MNDQQQPIFGNGKICYIEIPAISIEVSSRFYETVFRWRLRHDNGGNVSFDDGVGQVSGRWVTNRAPMREAGLVISIMVDDIADAIKKVNAHGGKVGNANTGGTEKTAWFHDPAGNLFGLYQHGD